MVRTLQRAQLLLCVVIAADYAHTVCVSSKVREDELKQRILKKELSMQSKADQAVYEQRQRAIAIAVVSLARWR
jgi:hypothetical protein